MFGLPAAAHCRFLQFADFLIVNAPSHHFAKEIGAGRTLAIPAPNPMAASPFSAPQALLPDICCPSALLLGIPAKPDLRSFAGC